jgi:hypothetical protein
MAAVSDDGCDVIVGFGLRLLESRPEIEQERGRRRAGGPVFVQYEKREPCWYEASLVALSTVDV